MASFDNLVARKDSSVPSYRSDCSGASNTNVSETRDISRQSEVQARHSHLRAIQARKIIFLVLILILMLGGLSYAIYKVVSNQTDEEGQVKIELKDDNQPSEGVNSTSRSDLHHHTTISPSTPIIAPFSTSTSGQNTPVTQSHDHHHPSSVFSSTTKQSSLHYSRPVASSKQSDQHVEFSQSQKLQQSSEKSFTVSQSLSDTTLIRSSSNEKPRISLSKTNSVNSKTTVIDNTQRSPVSSNGVDEGTRSKSRSNSQAPHTNNIPTSTYDFVKRVSTPSDEVVDIKPTRSSIGSQNTTSESLLRTNSVNSKTTVIDNTQRSPVSSNGVDEGTRSNSRSNSQASHTNNIPTSTYDFVKPVSTPSDGVVDIRPTLSSIGSQNTTSESLLSTESLGAAIKSTGKAILNSLQSTRSTSRSALSSNVPTSTQVAGKTKSSVKEEAESSSYHSKSSTSQHESVALFTSSFTETVQTSVLASVLATSINFTTSSASRQSLFEHKTASDGHTNMLVNDMSTSISKQVPSVESQPNSTVNLHLTNNMTISASTTTADDLSTSTFNLATNSPLTTDNHLLSPPTSETESISTETGNLFTSITQSSYMSITNQIISQSPTSHSPSPWSNTVVEGTTSPPLSVVPLSTTPLSESTPYHGLTTKTGIILNTDVPTTAHVVPSAARVVNSSMVTSSVWVAPYYLAWTSWDRCTLECGGGYTQRTRGCSKPGHCNHLGSDREQTTCNMVKCNETNYTIFLNLTDFAWDENLSNQSSEAYQELVEIFTQEIRDLYGPNVTIQVINISKGSVLVHFTITLSNATPVQKLIDAFGKNKLGNLNVSMISMINNMVPRKTQLITAQNITHNSVHIRWSALNSSMTNGILLGYKMKLTPGNISIYITDANQTSVEVANLTAETVYTVNLHGYNINGDGDAIVYTFQTNEPPPHYLEWGPWGNCTRDCGGGITTRRRNCSKPGLCGHLGSAKQSDYCNVFTCNTTSYTITANMTDLEWTDDLYNTSSKAYQDLLKAFVEELQKKYPNATISLDSITKGSVLFTFTITHGEGKSETEEEVTENLESGVGNFTTEVNGIVNNNLPQRPPENISLLAINQKTAVIEWLCISEEFSNGAILGYVIAMTHLQNTTTIYDIKANADDTTFSFTFKNLTYNTTYSFYMYGYNVNGDGPHSDLIHFTTKVQIPQVENISVSDVSQSSAVIHWAPLPNYTPSYGEIDGYIILVTGKNVTWTYSLSPEHETHNLTSLQPNATYTFTITAFNAHCTGVVSRSYTFETPVYQAPEPSTTHTSHSETPSSTQPHQQVTVSHTTTSSVNYHSTTTTSSTQTTPTPPHTTTIPDTETADSSQVHTTTSVVSVSSQNHINPHTTSPLASSTFSSDYNHIDSSSSSVLGVLVLEPSKTSSHTPVLELSSTQDDPNTAFSTRREYSTSTNTFVSTTIGVQPTATTSLDSNPPTTTTTPVPPSPTSAVVNSIISTSTETPMSTSPKTSTPASDPDGYIAGKITFTEQEYTPELANEDTEIYQKTKEGTESALTSLFVNQSLEVNKVDCYAFTPGSVVVHFYIQYKERLNYTKAGVVKVLIEAQKYGLDSKVFKVKAEDFYQQNTTPTAQPTTANESNKGLQKNEDDDDSAMIVAVVLCALLALVGIFVVIYVGNKRKWFARSTRKIMPDDEDDEEDEAAYERQSRRHRLRLKTARGARSARAGSRTNAGHDTTEC